MTKNLWGAVCSTGRRGCVSRGCTRANAFTQPIADCSAPGGSGVTGTDDAPRRPLAVTRCSSSQRMVADVVFGNIDLLTHLPKTSIS
jgi:hypothetical protein